MGKAELTAPWGGREWREERERLTAAVAAREKGRSQARRGDWQWESRDYQCCVGVGEGKAWPLS